MKRFLQGIVFSTLLLSLGAPVAKAQYILKEADAQYRLYNYTKAIEIYEQAYKKKATLYTAEKLADSYEKVKDYKQTESWYAIASNMADSPKENVLNYAKALQNNSKYAEAKTQYEKYISLNKEVTPGDQSKWLLSCDSAVRWMKFPTSVIINNDVKLNSKQSDWGTGLYGKSIVFASDRGKEIDKTSTGRPFLKFDGAKTPDKKIYGWTGNGYLHLYIQNGTDSAVLFPLETGTDYHVGPASFTANGNEMYFTLTRIPQQLNYVNGKLATVNVELYTSKKDADGKWAKPTSFKYNKVNEYSVGDPYITGDGQTLYFASNMPGGLGGSDLYVSYKTDAGDWGLPINLKEVNSDGNERTPIFDGANNFYFSSDGRVGMGGLDIYLARLVGGKISVPKNLGYPTNSPQDDFAYLKTGALSGYLSSDRNGGMGSDDIYSFTEQQIFALKLIGTAFDKTSGQPLSGALVTLAKINGTDLKVQTDTDGKFAFNLEKSLNYTLSGKKTAYLADAAEVSTVNLTASTTLEKNLYLEKIVIGKAIKIENIYYDFDKSNIRPDAAVELDKLVKILQDNPTIWIELGSHTDSRGNDQYNQWLSQSRANAAVQYIIDRGINKNRITAKGYGESKLLNKCANGVKCTEAQHQLNRRTEFKIVKQ